MDFAGIAGLILILAGIAWIFLAQYGPGRRRARGGGAPTGFLDKVLEWASKNIARKFLPGVLMIVVGAFILVGAGDDDDAGGKGDTSGTTAVQTSLPGG